MKIRYKLLYLLALTVWVVSVAVLHLTLTTNRNPMITKPNTVFVVSLRVSGDDENSLIRVNADSAVQARNRAVHELLHDIPHTPTEEKPIYVTAVMEHTEDSIFIYRSSDICINVDDITQVVTDDKEL